LSHHFNRQRVDIVFDNGLIKETEECLLRHQHTLVGGEKIESFKTNTLTMGLKRG